MRAFLILILGVGSGISLHGKQSLNPPGLKAGERVDILFAAEAPPSANDQSKNSTLQILEPIAFVARGGLRQCDSAVSEADSTTVRKAVRGELQKAYTRGRSYAVWQGGAPWGHAEAVRSCMDDDMQLMTGCFRFHPDTPQTSWAKDFHGIAFTAQTPVPSHAKHRQRAGKQERAVFLQAVSGVLRENHVSVAESHIRLREIWQTQLRADHLAIAGSALVQIPTREVNAYRSYRIFAVFEEEHQRYKTVLASFRKSTITGVENPQTLQQGGELDEGEQTDREEFFDNFPIFPDEPDAVITRHSYYEDWNFSIYRWRNGIYERTYTGCGGGV